MTAPPFPRLASSIRSAVFWLCLGYLASSYHMSGGNGFFPSSSVGVGRLLLEDPEGHVDVDEGGHLSPGEEELGESIGEGHSLHGEEEEEEEEPKRFVTTTSVTVTLLVLFFFTIAFEYIKEHIEEHASRAMKPVITSMFGELTVLGFLSVVTFIAENMGVFTKLSKELFGVHEEDELTEIFETVHYSLFFVMIFFCFGVTSLVNRGMELEVTWVKMNYVCIGNSLEEAVESASAKKIDTEELAIFYSVRDAFIKNHSLNPPFKPQNDVPSDFNYGKYLAMCMGDMLKHAVEIRVHTWGLLAVLTVVFYVLWLCVNYNLMLLAWIWVAFFYLVIVFDVLFERYLVNIRRSLSANLTLKGTPKEENTALLEGGEEHLPSWCKIDLEAYMSNRPWLAQKFCKVKPNRQDTLFFLEKHGPHAHTVVFQLNTIFTAVYSTGLILIYLQAMYKEGLVMFIVYLVVAIIPLFIKKQMVVDRITLMSEISCIGALRKQRAVEDITRHDKTVALIRIFIVICKLHESAEAGFPTKPHHGSEDSHLIHEIAKGSIGKTFDILDESKDGFLSTDELGEMMEKLGMPLSEENLAKMIASLDENSDGQVSKDEFIQWYIDQVRSSSMGVSNFAHHIFHLIDRDGVGEITIDQFREFLHSINAPFSVDDIGLLVMELDEDGTGMTSLEEFEELIETYYPYELRGSHGGH